MEVRAAVARGQGKEGRGKEMGVSRIPRIWKLIEKLNLYQKKKKKLGNFPKIQNAHIHRLFNSMSRNLQTDTSAGRCLNKDVDYSVCVRSNAKEPLNVHPEETVKSSLVHPISRKLCSCYKGWGTDKRGPQDTWLHEKKEKRTMISLVENCCYEHWYKHRQVLKGYTRHS